MEYAEISTGRVFGPGWLRGPARFEGGELVLDEARATRTVLNAASDELLFDLAGLRTPDDGLAFVQRYGLLRSGPDSVTHREPWAEWEAVRSKLNGVLHLHRFIELAIAQDPDAWDWLRRNVTPTIPREGRPSAWLGGAPYGSRDETLFFATRMVQTVAAEGMEGVEMTLVPRFEVDPAAGPGGLILAPLAPTLLGLAYFRLAQLLVNQTPARECEECRRFFTPHDARQRFHSATCGSRNRQRRLVERRRAGS